MAIKLFITGESGTSEVTQFVPTATWSGDYKQCARTLDFGLLSSPTDKNIPVISCELGSGVILKQDDTELFNGFIVTRTKSTESSVIDITCYDRGIYLKRNKAVYQSANMTAEAVACRLCDDFSITPGSIAVTDVKLMRNFIGVSLYQIIQTMYTLASESTGEKYQIRFEGQKLSVIKKGVTDTTLIIEGGSNLMSAVTTESVADMVNQVVIYDENDNRIGTHSDAEMQKLYGLMQEYIKKSKDTDADAKAKKLLEDNGVSQKITINNLGNIANLTGGAVVIREPYTGLYGLFYIDSDVHTWKNGLYLNKLVVNFKRIMDEQEAGSLPNATGSKTSSSSSSSDTPVWTYNWDGSLR